MDNAVWIVILWDYNNFDEIVGVFRTEESAKECKAEEELAFKGCKGYACSIEKAEVK